MRFSLTKCKKERIKSHLSAKKHAVVIGFPSLIQGIQLSLENCFSFNETPVPATNFTVENAKMVAMTTEGVILTIS